MAIILLVDDDMAHRTVIRELLEEAGHEVDEAVAVHIAGGHYLLLEEAQPRLALLQDGHALVVRRDRGPQEQPVDRPMEEPEAHRHQGTNRKTDRATE